MRDWNSIHYALQQMDTELHDAREALYNSQKRRLALSMQLADANMKIKELLTER
jgi:hypothetical protein